MRAAVISLVVVLVGCKGSVDPVGLAVLGYEDDLEFPAQIEVMLTSDDGLNVPRDLAFDPETPTRLWVVNQEDDSVTIVEDAGTASQTSEHRIDPYALHFMEEVSSIAFGAPGTFGTCQESRNTYNDQGPGNDFMGPALWSSALSVFGESNPAAVDYLTQLYGQYVDLGSHLDMQHETPLCTGIAWEKDNVYWTFDGVAETIDRVDFGQDHGAGFDDHSDGITAEYVPGEIGYEEGVSTHMLFDQATGMLYVADPSNGRVAMLDTTTGTKGADLSVTEAGTLNYEMNGATITDFIGADAGLDQPSGLARAGDIIFVTDYGTGFIHAYDVLTGEKIDALNTNRGSDAIMGITAVSETELWVTDVKADEVFRITPAAQPE